MNGGLPGSGDDGFKPLQAWIARPERGSFLGEKREREKGFDGNSSWMDPSRLTGPVTRAITANQLTA